MLDDYVKIMIDGFEQSVNIFWLHRVVRLSTYPGKEEGTAYLDDDEQTSGAINNEGIEKVRRIRPEIIKTPPLVALCEKLKKDEEEKEKDEWWEELQKA